MIFCPDAHKPYQRPEATSIYQLLKIRAEKNPEAIAIIASERPALTYGRLLTQVESTVAMLRAFGINRNDRVALVVPNGPAMAVAFIGVVAGATCAPLNPAYRTNEFDFYLSDLNAKALLIGSEMDSPVREVAGKAHIPIIELTPTPDVEAGLFELTGKKLPSSATDGFAQPEDIALVLHTSGTTSRPKIVPLTHRNICSSGHNIAVTLKLTEHDRCLNVMPLFHIHGLIGAVLSSLTAGASVVCTSGFAVERFFAWVETWQPTWYSAVPTMHQAIVARASEHQDVIARHPMRFIRSCSAPLPERVMAALEDVFRTPVIESYGMTEASHQMTSQPLPPLPRKAGSVGVAAGPEVAILDEVGNLLPMGAIGEVVIRGVNVMDGYANNPAANRSAFTHGWFRTGDQGRFDADGYLFLTGRLKEIINRGGEKIAPKEVDEVLTQYPAVSQAVAFAVPHPTLGEEVAAAVVVKKDTAVTESDLRDFAAARLADFKVPRQILIVEEIPQGPTGKLQRIGLADKLADQLAWHRQHNFVLPTTAMEKQLTEIWQELLHVEHVGVRDNFFALGGDSLAIARMMLAITERFNTIIPTNSFFRSPTIETIASLIQGKEATISQGPVRAAQAKGFRPIRDSVVIGLKNRLFQFIALYVPGFKTIRVQLHRWRGVTIGTNVSIGLAVIIETAYPRLISIGNNVTIGIRSTIIGHLRDSTVHARDNQHPTVHIEDNVYIGPGVIILPNVTIGHGAVVSAGSVVSRSIPPQTLARGNPAEPLAHCGVSLGGGVSYEEFIRHLTPIKAHRSWGDRRAKPH
jgi:acyl-CoA synthetase (AMP-forming)/AMP-acid ligase II/acetyltransferase-like isoleucine patch superfamily enzyme/acyl carrier protein